MRYVQGNWPVKKQNTGERKVSSNPAGVSSGSPCWHHPGLHSPMEISATLYLIIHEEIHQAMRLFTLLLAFACFGHLHAQKKPIEVYLIGGQSNATGQGYMANIPEDFVIDSTVMFFYSGGLGGGGVAMQWGPLCQASETPDKFGVELSMGTALKKRSGGKEIALIKHALSGSNLYAQWNPGKDNEDELNFGPEYRKFVQTVDEALKGLRDRSYDPAIMGMVWQQGEGDARDIAGMEHSNQYGENLRHFVQRVREQFDSPQMLFVYGYVIPVPLKRFTGREEVRVAQKYMDQGSGHPLALQGALVVETDDLPLRCDEPSSPHPRDSVHFNTYGILELGERFAGKLAEFQ